MGRFKFEWWMILIVVGVIIALSGVMQPQATHHVSYSQDSCNEDLAEEKIDWPNGFFPDECIKLTQERYECVYDNTLSTSWEDNIGDWHWYGERDGESDMTAKNYVKYDCGMAPICDSSCNIDGNGRCCSSNQAIVSNAKASCEQQGKDCEFMFYDGWTCIDCGSGNGGGECSLSNSGACTHVGARCMDSGTFCDDAFIYNSNYYCDIDDTIICECSSNECVSDDSCSNPTGSNNQEICGLSTSYNSEGDPYKCVNGNWVKQDSCTSSEICAEDTFYSANCELKEKLWCFSATQGGCVQTCEGTGYETEDECVASKYECYCFRNNKCEYKTGVSCLSDSCDYWVEPNYNSQSHAKSMCEEKVEEYPDECPFPSTFDSALVGLIKGGDYGYDGQCIPNGCTYTDTSGLGALVIDVDAQCCSGSVRVREGSILGVEWGYCEEAEGFCKYFIFVQDLLPDDMKADYCMFGIGGAFILLALMAKVLGG